MKYSLHFSYVLFWLVGWSFADNLQDFIEAVANLNRDYELEKIPAEKFLYRINLFKIEKLTEEDVRCILAVEIPTPQEISKMVKKQWTQLERKIFVKIVLLALLGHPKRANSLLEQFENNLMETDVPIIPTSHPWIILWNCISFSYCRMFQNIR